jgi:hypothetical protein
VDQAAAQVMMALQLIQVAQELLAKDLLVVMLLAMVIHTQVVAAVAQALLAQMAGVQTLLVLAAVVYFRL